MYFIGCGNNETTVAPPAKNPNVSGTIINWSSGGNILLKAILYDTSHVNFIVLDSSIVSSSGYFELEIRDVSDSYLSRFSVGSSCSSNVFVTPNTRISQIVEYNLYNDTGMIGRVNRNNSDVIAAGTFNVYYYFVNQTSSVTGNINCATDTVTWNMNWSDGLNKFVTITDNFPVTHYTYTSIEPAGGRWISEFFLTE